MPRWAVQMGYVAAERTMLIHRAWGEARDVKAVFQRATAYGPVIRVSFDGNPPSLPPAEPHHDSAKSYEAEWPEGDDRWVGVDELPPEK